MNFNLLKANAENFKFLKKLITNKKTRDTTGLFVCEGLRLSLDGVLSGSSPEKVYITEAALKKYKEAEAILNASKEAYFLPEIHAEKISDTVNCQGIFTVFKKPLLMAENSGKEVFLSSVRDPGNIGTIMRTCEAFGVSRLVLSSDCADVYSPKVLRASMGAVFRLPVFAPDNLLEEIISFKNAGGKVYAAVLGEDAADISRVPFAEKSAVLLGNEASGLDEETAVLADCKVLIPMQGKAESLNVSIAAGICIYEMTKLNRQ